MISELGIYLRKIRMREGERLFDMAKKLDVSSSFLSAVENSKRDMPEDRLKDIARIYNLDENEYKKLKYAELLSRSSISIDLNGLNLDQRKLALKFSSKIDKLNEEKIYELNEALE